MMMNLWDNNNDTSDDEDNDNNMTGFGGDGGGGAFTSGATPSNFETVPLTPRESNGSSLFSEGASSTGSSVTSRSVYLSFFKSPSLTTTTTPNSQNTTSLGGAYGCSTFGSSSDLQPPPPPTRLLTTTKTPHRHQRNHQRHNHHHHYHHTTPAATTNNINNMLYPVRENYSTTSDYDDEDDKSEQSESDEDDRSEVTTDNGYYLSWQQQQYHDQQRRHSEQFSVAVSDNTPQFRNTTTNHHYSNHSNNYNRPSYDSNTSTNDSGSVFQSVQESSYDDDSSQDEDSIDGLSILSSTSHLFGENLLQANNSGSMIGGHHDIEQGNNGRDANFPPIPNAANSASYYADPPTPTPRTVRQTPSRGWGLFSRNHHSNNNHRYYHNNARRASWTFLPSWNNITTSYYNRWSSSNNMRSSSLRTPRNQNQQPYPGNTNTNTNKRKRLTLSPRSRNLQDLQYLTQQHQNKVQQLLCLLTTTGGNNNPSGGDGDGTDEHENGIEIIDTSATGNLASQQQYHDGHYDFVLVLKPQEVYGFWSELLDFREELLGPEAVQAMEELKLSSEQNSTANNNQNHNESSSQKDLHINSTDDTDEVSLTTSPSISSSSASRGNSSSNSSNSTTTDEYEDGEDDDELRSLTPRNNSGLRNRRGGFGQTPQTDKKNKNLRTPTSSTTENMALFTSPGISIMSRASTTTCPSTLTRKSVFERAMGSPTTTTEPTPPTADVEPSFSGSQSKSILPVQQRWLNPATGTDHNINSSQQQLNASFTSAADTPSTVSGGIMSTPAAASTTTTTAPASLSAVPRRRWGNQAAGQYNTPSMISPPIRSITRGSSMHNKILSSSSSAQKKMKKKSQQHVQVLDPEQPPPQHHDDLRNEGDNGEGTATPSGGIAATGGANNDNTNNNPNILTMNDIPSQRFARGIANRTNGMLPFLSALKRGIVLRKHRPNKSAVYCKLYSDDGGDTIKYVLVDDPDEAINAFKEQRVRYNKIKYPQQLQQQQNQGRGVEVVVEQQQQLLEEVMAQPWSLSPSYSEEDHDNGGSSDRDIIHRSNDEVDLCSTVDDSMNNKKFDKPDYVAAQQYRERQQKQHSIAHQLKTIAKRIVCSGTVRAQDIAVVHPATFVDPRTSSSSSSSKPSSGSMTNDTAAQNDTNDEVLGTTTFRRSKSDYDSKLSFSLVSTLR